jgi:hypothetical protein
LATTIRDYDVTFTREETIADLAAQWRRADGSATAAYFNVVQFLEQVLCPWLKSKNRPLHFKFFDAADGEDFAYVTVEPLTLNIDREIWNLARDGEPFTRRIVAHEIGHIIQHGHYPKAAFSNGSAAHFKFIVKWRSAEWQADTFMELFLLPTPVVAAFASPEELAAACSVELELATKRFDEVRNDKLRQMYGSTLCKVCGQFTCSGAH